MDVREINKRVIAQYRAGAEIEGMHRDRLLLLTTTGRRSGAPHTTPMMFHRDDDRVLVIASNQGAPQHPEWYLNLATNPAVTVELGDETYSATAEPLRGEDYDRVWADIKRLYPFFADHEKQAGRTIPVVMLDPGQSAPG